MEKSESKDQEEFATFIFHDAEYKVFLGKYYHIVYQSFM